MAEDPHQLMPEPEILGLGMSVLDSIQVIEEFPSGTGVTEVSQGAMMGGGPVPTALCVASKLGAGAGIVDRIGDDWKGDLIRRDYERFGVETAHLISESGCQSTFSTILVRRRDGERHIVFERGDFTPFSVGELPRETIDKCRVLHLNGRHWPACVEAARWVKEAGGKVSFDGGANRFDQKVLTLLPLVDVLIVARDFAECLSETLDRDSQLRSLRQWDAEVVGITDGGNGSWFATDGGATFHQPAFPIDAIVDTTGCGDVFHGAFLYWFCQGGSWRECARFASATAAISAKGLGGRGKLPSLSEVRGMLG